jgi:MFS family permease
MSNDSEVQPEEPAEANANPEDHPEVGGAYAKYVLGVLVLVYVFNFIDRQIISILAEEIKADLGINDAQIGFLYGTVFAVFYAIFGIPLARLADVWTRKNLISIGLFFWSAMTALSGTARGFVSLTGYRIGVGIGEASASPSAFSMLGDYFPPRLRATAMAIYSSGVYIGSGIGMFLGGWIVKTWDDAYPNGDAPFDLAGWHVAFFAVGIPGLLMALWVYTLREPIRGMSEGITDQNKEQPNPLKVFGTEVMAVLPPFTIISLILAKAPTKVMVNNFVAAALLGFAAWGMTWWLGEMVQWVALSVGLYASFSWMQGLALRDKPTFTMIYQSRAVVFGMIGFASITFVTYGLGFWFAPYYIREHGEDIVTVGRNFGLASAIGGWLGVTLGGIFSDWFRRRTPRARPYIGFIAITLTLPFALTAIYASNPSVGYASAYVYNAVSSMWIGSAVALANELVLPRMRATASAFYILAVTFIGLALGPFTIGKISVALAEGGMAEGLALQRSMALSLLSFVVAGLCFVISAKYVEREESTRIERARKAGEPGI